MTIRDWKWAAIVGWLVVIGLVVIGINTPPVTVLVSETVPAGYLPACEHEDDNNCYWGMRTLRATVSELTRW